MNALFEPPLSTQLMGAMLITIGFLSLLLVMSYRDLKRQERNKKNLANQLLEAFSEQPEQPKIQGMMADSEDARFERFDNRMRAI